MAKERATLAQDVRERLRLTGKSQAQVAEATGVPQTTISRFVRGASDIAVGKFERLLRFVEAHEASTARAARKASKRGASYGG